MSGPRVRRIMLVAGEPSGDVLGARLMAALKLRTLGAVEFSGVGGEHMAAQGLASLFPMEELSVMGAVEVLPRAVGLLRRVRETAQAALDRRPDAVLTIDSPAFNFRVARRLAGQGIPLIHYVAPSVWAWRPGRARTVARFLDHLMALLPFEPPYFEREGLPCSFVGHPVLESGAGRGDGRAFRARWEISAEARVVLLLPGSRRGEVARHLPIFGEALRRLRSSFPDLVAVVPTVPAVAEQVAAVVEGWPARSLAVAGEGEKHAAMAASDAAMAASGTVALELALAGVPTVVAYRMNPVTMWLARRLVRVPHVSLANILLEREVMPELIQGACRPDRLAAEIAKFLVDPASGGAQSRIAEAVTEALAAGDEPPSLCAADVVLGVIDRGPRRSRGPGEGTIGKGTAT